MEKSDSTENSQIKSSIDNNEKLKSEVLCFG